MSSDRRGPGRPPAADGAATRRRILVEARHALADLGYLGTTYRELRLRTGLTTATLYHYFPSKLELYEAVVDDVYDTMYDSWILPALDGCVTLVEHVDAFLDAAQRMHHADPSLTVFVLSSRIDTRRDPELASVARGQGRNRKELFGRMADAGIASGELERERRDVFIDTFDALSSGLVVATADPKRYANALDGIRRMVRNELVNPVSAKSTAARSRSSRR